MVEDLRKTIRSRELAVKLYDSWVRDRQRREDLNFADGKAVQNEHRSKNFSARVAAPRKKHLEQLREVSQELFTADKVALLVMMELPPLEISSLLHRLSVQLVSESKATFFSKVNQLAACGCGCG